MILLPSDLCDALRANDIARRNGSHSGAQFDPTPLVKLFNPLGPATWLATELDPDGDTLFGLADLGFGYPELGAFSLAELASVRLAFGLRIERDIAFETDRPLSVWTDYARRTRSLLVAETDLRRTLRDAADLPPPTGG